MNTGRKALGWLFVIIAVVVLALLLYSTGDAQSRFPGCNISSRDGLVCDGKPGLVYRVYLPIVFNSDPIPSLVRWTDGLLEQQIQEFCGGDNPECQEWPGIPFEYEAPSGYVISFVRLFAYSWGQGGSHFIYPNAGCVMKVCVTNVDGSIWEKTATKIRIHIDEDLIGWGGPINLIDICHEKEGYPYIIVCDNSYLNKYPTFQVEPNTKEKTR